jgi:hypothetical protein
MARVATASVSAEPLKKWIIAVLAGGAVGGNLSRRISSLDQNTGIAACQGCCAGKKRERTHDGRAECFGEHLQW